VIPCVGTRSANVGCSMWKPETPSYCRSPWPSLFERSDGRRMGAGRADDPSSQARRPPPRGKYRYPRGSKRRLLYVLSTGCQWQALPKDLPPKSTAHCPVGLGWHAGAPPSHALRRDTRAGRARGEPDGRDHRQPEPPKPLKSVGHFGDSAAKCLRIFPCRTYLITVSRPVRSNSQLTAGR
jgi:hypothetical protein